MMWSSSRGAGRNRLLSDGRGICNAQGHRVSFALGSHAFSGWTKREGAGLHSPVRLGRRVFPRGRWCGALSGFFSPEREGSKSLSPKHRVGFKAWGAGGWGLNTAREQGTAGRVTGAPGPGAPVGVPLSNPCCQPCSCLAASSTSGRPPWNPALCSPTALNFAAETWPTGTAPALHLTSQSPHGAFLAWQREQQKLLPQPPRAIKLRNVIETRSNS